MEATQEEISGRMQEVAMSAEMLFGIPVRAIWDTEKMQADFFFKVEGHCSIEQGALLEGSVRDAGGMIVEGFRGLLLKFLMEQQKRVEQMEGGNGAG